METEGGGLENIFNLGMWMDAKRVDIVLFFVLYQIMDVLPYNSLPVLLFR